MEIQAWIGVMGPASDMHHSLEWPSLLRQLEGVLLCIKLSRLQDAGKVLALLLGNLQQQPTQQTGTDMYSM